jgi:hypothetical protein
MKMMREQRSSSLMVQRTALYFSLKLGLLEDSTKMMTRSQMQSQRSWSWARRVGVRSGQVSLMGCQPFTIVSLGEVLEVE